MWSITKSYNNSFPARAKHSRNGLPRIRDLIGTEVIHSFRNGAHFGYTPTTYAAKRVSGLIDVRIQYTVEHTYTTTRIHISLLELNSWMSVNYNFSFADPLGLDLKKKK